MKKGMSILEVLIASSIITVGIITLIQTYSVYVSYALSNNQTVQVSFLLEEGIEAVTLMRDNGWTANIAPVSTATTSLYFNGTMWQFASTTNEYIDGLFVRNVTFSPVYRDGAGKIASTGTLDANTKKVTVTIQYPQRNGTTTETLSKYLHNLYVN